MWYLGRNAFVEKNYPLAVLWYEKAADKGFAPAIHRLGHLNRKGLGVPRNKQKALSLLQLAVSKGNLRAQAEYARCLILGYEGILGVFKGLRMMISTAPVIFRVKREDTNDIRVI